MKLTLDHTQRLNLHALLGAQRADVGSIRAIWAVQDKIALAAEEANTLGHARSYEWAGARRLESRALDSSPRVRIDRRGGIRLKAALATWDSYAAGGDRHWLEPLLDALLSEGTAER